MAWVKQIIESEILSVDLNANDVTIRGVKSDGSISHLVIKPEARVDAHDAALVLRRAARRLEEIGKGLD